MKSLRLLTALALPFLVFIPSRALEWKKTLIAVAAEPGDDVVRTQFEYKNSSPRPVHILDVSTSCGCTEASPDTSEVAPGESGKLWILFTVGKRTGLQEKEILVRTDENNPPVKLMLKVTIPPAAK
jgi:hypothetical protein